MSNEINTENERDPDMDESCNCGLLYILLCCFRRRRSRNPMHQSYQGQSKNTGESVDPHRHNTDCNTYRYRQADGTFRDKSICNSQHQSVSYVR